MELEHVSAERLLRWRAACGLLNPKRRFRFTANIEERIEASNMRNTNQVNPSSETTPVRWISQHGSYVVPEHFDEAGYAISADDATFIVEGHNSEKLKLHGGVEGIAKKLKTCTTNGLAIDDDLTCRQQLYGTNEFTEPELRSFWVFMFEAFQDVTLMVLALCAFVLLIADTAPVGWQTGPHGAFGIMAGILLVVLVTATKDYFQSLRFRHLDKESKKISIEVTRNGCRKKLPISALLTGDIVHLSIGDQVPADGLFISGYSFSVDKSILTGESELVKVDTENPYLLSGSKVQDGSCKMLVVTVGMRTQWGKLSATLTESGNNETPLQVRLNGLTTIIGKTGLIFAIMTFVVLVQKLLPTVVVDVSQWSWSADVAYKLLVYFSIAVATVVVAVPEGLSMAVTMSLAYAMMEMIGDKVLIRNPAALETMASVTTICSDVTVRPGVKESVALCRSAGITVRMVTRDDITTAKAIARECGILTDDGIAIDGPDFCKKSPVELVNIIPKIQVMARASPQDMLTLVEYLKNTFGEVVAVTGDGTYDAPVLHEADIGLAMGIQATEVAKESADVIILDDNFSKIVTMVKWGRSVYANIQKFIQFQLTVNIVALTVNFTSACLTGSAPLTAVQLLWVNMIMDTLGALALVTEPPTDELMKRVPVVRKGSLISTVMWRNISGQALYQFAAIGLLQLKGKSFFSLDGDNSDLILNTLIFNSFVFCQLFNMVNSREMEKENVLNGLWKNKRFLSVIAATVVFQVIIVEFLGPFANTSPLTATQWLFSLSTGFLSMPVALLLKRIPENYLDFSKCLAGFIKGLQRFWSVFVCGML